MTTPALAENVKGKGRHYRHPSGDLCPSVTNVLNALNKPALPRWAARVVAEQAWEMRHSLESLGQAEAVDILKGSPWRTSSRAAGRGDAIHEALEEAVWGRPIPTLEGQAARFEPGMRQFLADHSLVPWRTEVTLFGNGYAGTADFIGTFDGVPAVVDYKTGKDLYPEVALQLSALASCHAAVVDGHLMEPPDIEVAVGVVITEDGYKVRQVGNVEECARVFRALLDVWRWQNSGSPLMSWHASATEGGAVAGTAGSDAQPASGA